MSEGGHLEEHRTDREEYTTVREVNYTTCSANCYRERALSRTSTRERDARGGGLTVNVSVHGLDEVPAAGII